MNPLEPLAVALTGTQLVEASAGSGKTHTLTTLYVRLLLERRLGVEQILVVTFTNAATAELKDRVRARIRMALLTFEGRTADDPELAELARRSSDRERAAGLLRAALRSLDQAAVFTIHGFCQRVLAEHAFESAAPFDQQLVTEQLPLLLEVVQDFWARELAAVSEAEVEVVFANGGLASLLSLARVALDWPDTPVVPEPEPVSTAAAVREYLMCRERLRAHWPGSRPQVERLLGSSKLHRGRYDPDKIRETLGALDALTARSDAALAGFTKPCRRLCASTLARETTKGGRAPEHPLFDLLDELAECHQRALSELDRWWLELAVRLVGYVRQQMPRRKAERGVQSFDDLLRQVSRALSDRGGSGLAARLAERYAAALVDEFQDTDPIQYSIFRSVFGAVGGTLFLIGDPKQAIYAFRGADVFAYLEAARDARVRQWTLGTNWRSDPGLVGAINTLFSRRAQPFLLPEIGYHEIAPRPDARARASFPGAARAPLEIAFVPSALAGRESLTRGWAEAHLHRYVAAHVSRLLASGMTIDDRPIQAGDVAVLTRTNEQARRIQLELRALRIASVMHGDASVLDAPEAAELAQVLGALADPTDAARARSALATTLLGLDAAQIDRLQRDEAEWERWVDGLARWHSIWTRQGFIQAFRRLMRDTGMASRLLSLVDGDRRLTNVLHLVELLHQAAVERRLGVAGLSQWFCDVRFDRAKRDGIAADAQQVRLERDDRAVQLTTMHRSKGLEYPVVYCPYLWWQGGLFKSDKRVLRYHDPNDALRLKLDLRKPDDKSAQIELAECEARSESLRLAYVALTRAKQRCVMVWGAFAHTSSPLAHLLCRPDQDDASLRDELTRLGDRSGGTIEVCALEASPATEPAAQLEPTRALAARTFFRRLARCWRSSSFSALAAADQTLSVPAVIGRDVDEQPSETAAAPRSDRDELVVLHAFPRGARAGDLVHSVLEQLEFGAEPAAIAELVTSALDRWGFDACWREPLTSAISNVLRTRLAAHDAAPRLCDIPRARRLSELEFTFPVAPRGRPLVASDLASVLERNRPPEMPGDYPARVARLGFEPLTGFLRGFIDLVFEHQGAFWIADYKSNHLGPHPDDYRPERILHAMAAHHYHLQYLLYAVAVHRFLSARLADYDFERHFGGVTYLFLRGMHPSFGAERGSFHCRPARALIEGLSSMLGGSR